jgi:hypothetical protein
MLRTSLTNFRLNIFPSDVRQVSRSGVADFIFHLLKVHGQFYLHPLRAPSLRGDSPSRYAHVGQPKGHRRIPSKDIHHHPPVLPGISSREVVLVSTILLLLLCWSSLPPAPLLA